MYCLLLKSILEMCWCFLSVEKLLLMFSKEETEIFQPLRGQRAKECCRLGAVRGVLSFHSLQRAVCP